MIIQTNNVKKYQTIEKRFKERDIIIKFTFIYILYQNDIMKRFNRTLIELMKLIFNQLKLFINF